MIGVHRYSSKLPWWAPRPYTVIVPVKSFEYAKSRIDEDPVVRRALARSFALDTVTTANQAMQVGRVVVVTSDEKLFVDLQALGAHTVLEKRTSTGDMLNAAIRQGRSWAHRHHRHDPVAVLPADLPALTSRALDQALLAARKHESAFITDSHGLGTTLLTARRPLLLEPAYGSKSSDGHRALGACELESIDAGMRLDVDTMSDLAFAISLGVSPHTSNAVHAYLS